MKPGIIGQAFAYAITITCLALFAAVVVVPLAMRGASLTVLSGSMRPLLQPGDLAVVRGVTPDVVCDQTKIGNIVTFMPNPNDPALITHRLTGKTIGAFPDGTSCRLITQGDANSAADDPISPIQVRGVYMFKVPKLGWVRQWAAQHVGIVVAAGVAATAVYLLWGQWTRRKAAKLVLDDAEPMYDEVESTYDETEPMYDAAEPSYDDAVESTYDAAEPMNYAPPPVPHAAEPTYYAPPPAPYGAPVPAANVPRRALAEE